jgi:hypothetical protein
MPADPWFDPHLGVITVAHRQEVGLGPIGVTRLELVHALEVPGGEWAVECTRRAADDSDEQMPRPY